jgi:hypothetical protein
MGPAGGMFLGDMGADVIDIEPRVGGDMMRHFVGTWGVSHVLSGGRSAIFEGLSRNNTYTTQPSSCTSFSRGPGLRTSTARSAGSCSGPCECPGRVRMTSP